MTRLGTRLRLILVLAVTIVPALACEAPTEADSETEESALSLPPIVDSVMPGEGSVTGGTLVEIRGSNFARNARVRFGGTDAERVERVSRSLLHVRTPSHAAGAVDVTVANPRGGEATRGGAFVYVAGSAPEPPPPPPPPPAGDAPGPIALTPPPSAVPVSPGQDIQAMVNANPSGTIFVLRAGIHRLQGIQPKAGNQFHGELGATLTGARLLTTFSREGAYYVAAGQSQEGQVHGACLADSPRCNRPEELFFDDMRLRHVGSLAEVGPGKWYFDYGADKIYFADDPTGRRVETSVVRTAFAPTADDVTIENLVIEKYATPPQMGAIGDQTPRSRWIVEHNDVRYNHGAGIRLGSGSVARANLVHHNGQLGISGGGKDLLYERNEVSYNNAAGVDAGWEAGGSKFAFTDGLVVRCNFVHHNEGPGLWTDIDNTNALYERNVVVSNASMGIFHEISYRAVIRDNVVKWNSTGWFPWLYGSQILISTSSDVEVVGNVVEVAAAGGNAIGVIQQNRGSGTLGAYRGANNYVHDNVVTFLADVGITGAAADWDTASFWSSGNNRMDGNRYHRANAELATVQAFAWANGLQSWSSLRALGQEARGTFDGVVQADATPLAVPACQ